MLLVYYSFCRHNIPRLVRKSLKICFFKKKAIIKYFFSLKQVEAQRTEFNRRIQEHHASSGIINTGGFGDAPDNFGHINAFEHHFAPNPIHLGGTGNDPNVKTFGHASSTFSESTNNNGVKTHKSGGAGIINDNGKVTKFDFDKI